MNYHQYYTTNMNTARNKYTSQYSKSYYSTRHKVEDLELLTSKATNTKEKKCTHVSDFKSTGHLILTVKQGTYTDQYTLCVCSTRHHRGTSLRSKYTRKWVKCTQRFNSAIIEHQNFLPSARIDMFSSISRERQFTAKFERPAFGTDIVSTVKENKEMSK